MSEQYGLLGDVLSNPLFQIGTGLLARRDLNLGQALGGAVIDHYKHRNYQNALNAQQAEVDLRQKQQQYMAENYPDMQYMPPALQAQAFKSMYEQPKQTSLMQNLAAAGLQPGTPDYQQAMMQAINKPATQINLGPKLPAGYVWADPNNPSLGVAPLPGGPAEKATEGQLMAQGYSTRMTDAEAQIQALRNEGFDPGSIAQYGPAAISNFLASPEYQTYRAAQEDWVRAKLRKESGAVIGEEEMAREISTYFARPGDSAAVIKRKAKQRETAEAAMARSGGARYFRDWKGATSGGLTAEEMAELEQLRRSQR